MEIWKDIEGYEGLYQISSNGVIRSLGNNKTRKERMLKPIKNKYGYLQVILCKQGKPKLYLIHRLVALTFIDNPNNLPQVNHIDEDKTNNAVENLEFCDSQYNNNYGTRKQRVAESNTNNPKLSKSVLCIETGVIYASTMEVQRELGFSQGNISSACNGIYKTCGGFHWCYL